MKLMNLLTISTNQWIVGNIWIFRTEDPKATDTIFRTEDRKPTYALMDSDTM